MKISAGADTDPAELAKVLGSVKEKATPPKPVDEDCDCKNAVDKANAKGKKAMADVTQDYEIAAKGIAESSAKADGDVKAA